MTTDQPVTGIRFECPSCQVAVTVDHPRRTFVAVREDAGGWVVQLDHERVHRCDAPLAVAAIPDDPADLDRTPAPRTRFVDFDCPGCSEAVHVEDAFVVLLVDRNADGTWFVQVDERLVHQCRREDAGPAPDARSSVPTKPVAPTTGRSSR